MTMQNTYLIPGPDRDTFNSLPPAVRKELKATLQVIWKVDRARHGEVGR